MTDTTSLELSKKRMAPDEVDEACALWRSGDFTLDMLSSKFGVTTTALHRRFQRNGIIKGSNRQAAEEILNEELRKQAELKAKEMASSFFALREFCFKFNGTIARRAAQILANATEEKKDLALYKDTMKTLEIAQNIVSKTFETARSMAGKSIIEEEEEVLPTLKVENMTRADIDELRKQQRDEEMEAYGTDEDLDIIESDE